MKDIIGIILPVRRRPYNLTRFHAHWSGLTTGKSRVYVIIDTDDDTYDNVYIPREFTVIRQSYMPTVPKMNNALPQVLKECKYVAFIGDDIILKTTNWEQLVIDKLNELGKYSLIYPNDLLQGHKLATHTVFTSELLKKLGYIGIPTLWHTMVDLGWMHTGNYLNRPDVDGGFAYMKEIIFEHVHRDNQKAPNDPLYEQAYGSVWKKHDIVEFNKYYPK